MKLYGKDDFSDTTEFCIEHMVKHHIGDHKSNNDFEEKLKSEITEDIIGELNNIMIYWNDMESNSTLARTLHTLKQLLSFIDFDEVSELCQDLEIAVRQGNRDEVLRDLIISNIVK